MLLTDESQREKSESLHIEQVGDHKAAQLLRQQARRNARLDEKAAEAQDDDLQQKLHSMSLAAATLAIQKRRNHHMQALLNAEETHKKLIRTARYKLPVANIVEPEAAQAQLCQALQHDYEFGLEHGTGRPRCTSGSALRPHFSMAKSTRPKDIVKESEAKLSSFESKRSIPDTPPHWGVVMEPHVTRGHRKYDESIQRIRDTFKKVFVDVGQAFVYCDTYRVGYIELASMKVIMQESCSNIFRA
jgi:hypothetical protein